jgi:uncharacterized protein
MSLPGFLRQQSDGTLILAIKVQPRASKNEICEPMGGELKIKIAAPPVDSAANEELARYLAERLDCPRSAVRIVRGATSKHKSIAIAGVDAQQAAERLRPLP